MKNRKSARKVLEDSPYLKPLAASSTGRFSIKFDFNKSNLSCFVDQKRLSKLLASKRSKSHKTRKYSSKKKTSALPKADSKQAKSKKQPRKDQSPDILREASNSVLKLIEDRGVQCQWKQTEQPPCTNEFEEDHASNQLWSVFSVNSNSVQKSYASTMDIQPNYYSHVMTQNSVTNSVQRQNQSYEYKQKLVPFQPNSFEVRPQDIGLDPRTTFMIRNIPNKYTIKDLSQEIDYDFPNSYDFLYLPCDLKNNCNVGYGFINFVNTDCMEDFYFAFHNQKWSKFRSEKICVLTYARLQGLNSLIEHFQNSKVLNQKQKRFRPIIKQNAKIDYLIKTQQQR